MLDSELNSHDSDNNEGNGRARSEPEPASTPAAPATPATPVVSQPAVPAVPTPPTEPTVPAAPAALFQAPQVHFQPPAATAAPAAGGRDLADGGAGDAGGESSADSDAGRTGRKTTRGGRGARGARGGAAAGDGAGAQDDDLFSADRPDAGAEATDSVASGDGAAAAGDEGDGGPAGRRRRRRTGRSRGRAETAAGEAADADGSAAPDEATGASEPDSGYAGETAEDEDAGSAETAASGRRRRRKRRRGSADADVTSPDDPPDTVLHVREPHGQPDDVRPIKGSTRLEAKKQRRREGRESGRRRPPVITESEFLARRESVERTMIVRQRGDRTQIAVLEDGVLVEHYVNRTSHQSYVGNVYLGKVQNVLPSMEAAFVDIGKGRNAVLYAGEVNFDASGLSEGQPKRIESALKSGQSVIVQVTKDPVGHKGARLTSQISLPGRYLVYVPGASMTGISRKLPDTERNRLKHILKKVTPENAGVIVRTAAEGAAEAELDRDVTRLAAQWENIEEKAKAASAPALLYGEPDLTIRVVRDVFNEDFSKLIVSGDDEWDIIDEYVRYVAPHLADRLTRWENAPDREEGDVFAAYRIDEQLAKALERKVWLPSGGSLVIDRTEAMTVIDVNTGKFTGQGGNLEETVTRNNLEAAEEIVRQLRLRDVGGIVVIDFIDMVLESNRELVLRRLLECLARDRTKHQVAEVTSLGLVQMTRKRVGAGLLEAFSQPCECCNGRGVIITLEQPEPSHRPTSGHSRRPALGNGSGRNGSAGNGNGHSARTGQDRPAQPGQDRGAPDRVAQDAPAQDAPAQDGRAQDGPAQDGSARDRSARDRSSRDEAGHRGRRGRRDGRATAGAASASPAEAASASPAEAADTAPVASPVAAADDAPPVASSVLGDTAAATDASAPVRRTRAGSALARVTVTSDEPIAIVPAAADVLPAQDALPAQDPLPAQDAAADEVAADALPAQDTMPAQGAAADEVAADALPAEDPLPAQDAAAAEVDLGHKFRPENGHSGRESAGLVPQVADPRPEFMRTPQVPAVPPPTGTADPRRRPRWPGRPAGTGSIAGNDPVTAGQACNGELGNRSPVVVSCT